MKKTTEQLVLDVNITANIAKNLVDLLGKLDLWEKPEKQTHSTVTC